VPYKPFKTNIPCLSPTDELIPPIQNNVHACGRWEIPLPVHCLINSQRATNGAKNFFSIIIKPNLVAKLLQKMEIFSAGEK
ncbi:MAG: hypothetical protein PHS84_10060, partial [Paludibacter sp.]|nr:hypothetical protein [Paludibacter sp.]